MFSKTECLTKNYGVYGNGGARAIAQGQEDVEEDARSGDAGRVSERWQEAQSEKEDRLAAQIAEKWGSGRRSWKAKESDGVDAADEYGHGSGTGNPDKGLSDFPDFGDFDPDHPRNAGELSVAYILDHWEDALRIVPSGRIFLPL